MPGHHCLVAALLVAGLVAGCAHRSPLGPPTPTGATILGGPAATSVYPPPPGWKDRSVIPASQQQAQDTAISYLRKTLHALAPGVTLDATRYSGGVNVAPCQDVETGTSPNSLTTIGDLRLPAGVTSDAVITAAGQAWKSWGWYVLERDGFYKPNRFGYSTDGYSLYIMAAPQAGFTPSVHAVSLCFPPELRDQRGPFPMVLTGE
jgi:hypothetical protein